MDKNYRIPLDTFYIMIAQKVGNTATPTMARRYVEALQELLYEQLNENETFYLHGIGNFEKVIARNTGQYREVANFAQDCRRETRFIEPRFAVRFTIMDKILTALNEGDEKYPRCVRKRKYKPKEYQEIRNEGRRKEVEPLHKAIDRIVADARHSTAGYERDEEDGEEN